MFRSLAAEKESIRSLALLARAFDAIALSAAFTVKVLALAAVFLATRSVLDTRISRLAEILLPVWALRTSRWLVISLCVK